MPETFNCNACLQPYETVVESGITLDYCRPCKLVWFDKNELEQFCERNKIFLLSNNGTAEKSKHQCPKCSTSLEKIQQTDPEILSCPSCSGFLVASELIDDKLPETAKTRPLQQLDGPIEFIELLGLLLPWQ